MKNISILGSTGSIGLSALDVIKNSSSSFRIAALAAGRNYKLLNKQIELFKPELVSVLDAACADELESIMDRSLKKKTKILWGTEGYCEVASLKRTDIVLSAMVGAAGLLPTIEAIEAGKDIALANKETLVVAGRLVIEKATEKGISILPVDSEHSAIFQCLSGCKAKNQIERLILTASGGPFFRFSREQLAHVTVSDALKHPNWNMGAKITIDSASMMNKGLEVIEAHWLFDIAIDKIDILIHPQSIVHSMVEFLDGSIMGQMGVPDMRGPILYAFSYPERLKKVHPALDLTTAGALEFYRPDSEKFQTLNLAYHAARVGGSMPAVLNAANEIAVEAFMKGEIGFLDIPYISEKTMESHQMSEPSAISDFLNVDAWGRKKAVEIIHEVTKQR